MWAAIGNYLKNKLKDTAIKAALGDESSKRNIIIIGISCVSLFFVVIITVISIIIAPIMMANQLKEDLGEGTKLFFEKVGNVLTFKGWCADSDGSCREKAESKYYDELNSVYEEYKEDNIEIDIELITATIFYGSTLSEESFSESNNSYEKVDIGDISTLASHMVSGNRVDYKKYREYLVDTYIPKRFKDLYIYEDENASIEKIADEIMGFANSNEGKGSSNNFGSCKIINTECTGVTIDSGDYPGTYTLEEYVAGVVTHEVGTGWPDEAIKAQAIAARTFVLNYTNNCTNSIENSQGAQTFEPPTDNRIKEIVNSTAGMVMTYDNQIINAQYASWWGYDSDSSCGNYNNCSNGECTIELYKEPNKEKWTFTMPQNYFSWGAVTDNIQMSNDTIRSLDGHCRGMTQFGAKYLDLGLGYSYDQILNTFYSDGVELSTFGNSKNLCSQGSTTQGLIASNYSGFLQRVAFPTASDYYYSQDYFFSSNVGQCVWYAQRRALEIINTVSIDEDTRAKAEIAIKSTLGNGKDWWDNPTLTMFGTSTDYTQPKVGAFVVWKYTDAYAINEYGGTNYGHIGVIEAVDYDKQTVIVSEGWKNNWEDPNSIAYASFSINEYSFDWIKNYGRPSDYIFLGYVYLLD